MQLEITRTSRDLLAFQLYSIRQSKELKRGYCFQLFITFLIGGLISFFYFKRSISGDIDLLKLVACCGVTIFVLLNHFLNRASVWWKLRMLFWAALTDRSQQHQRVQLSPTELKISGESDPEPTIFEWPKIGGIHQTKRHLMVSLPDGQGVIFPKRCFASADEQQVFVQTALFYWQQACLDEKKSAIFITTENAAWLWLKRLADGTAFCLSIVLLALLYLFPDERAEVISNLRQRIALARITARMANHPIEIDENRPVENYCANPTADAIEELASIKAEEGNALEARDLYYESYLRFGLTNRSATNLGNLALTNQQFAEAEAWLRLALSQPSDHQTDSNWATISLAQTLREQGKTQAARVLLYEGFANDRHHYLGPLIQGELFALRKQEQKGWLVDFTQAQAKNLLAHERQRWLEGFPLPALPTKNANKTYENYLWDYAKALPEKSRHEIYEWLRNYSQLGDGQIHLVIIEEIPPTMTMDSYAQRFLNRLEKKDINDRVLLLVVLGQQKFWIQTSSLTRQAITDAEASQICQQTMLPYFQRQAYVPGIKAGLQHIARELHGQLPPVWQHKWQRKAGNFGQGMLSILVFLLGLSATGFILIIGHEIAHTVVGKCVGLHVYRIVIGSGRDVLSFRLWRLRVEFKREFHGGCTFVGAPQGYQSRLGIWLMVAAGPFFHLAVLAIFHLIYLKTNAREFLSSHSHLNILSYVLYFENWLLLVINSWPTNDEKSANKLRTDGYKLWRIPYYTEKELADYRIAGLTFEWLDYSQDLNFNQAFGVIKQARQEFPDHLVFELAHASTLLNIGKYEQGRGLAFSALQRVDENEFNMKCWAWNEIAYANVLLNRADLFAEADEFSQLAVKHDQVQDGSLIGTRGSVLLRLQRVDEGIELLKQSITKTSSKHGKAENTCWLAIGYAMQNDFDKARECLSQARKSKTVPYFFKQAEAEVAAMYDTFTHRQRAAKPSGELVAA